MKDTLQTRIPDEVWERARQALRRLLLVDYDGTLAPFHLDPMRARPDARALRALLRIVEAHVTEVAVVSGRPIPELEALLGSFPAHLVGEHGWEWRRPDGAVHHFALPDGLTALLDQATSVAEGEVPLGRVVRKRTSVVVHLRGLAPEQQTAILGELARLWSPFESPRGLKMRPIVEGIELRALGRDKGTAVLLLVGPVPDDAFAMYCGDDDTDEDAFRAVQAVGIGIRVGADERATAAHLRVDSIEELAVLLETWWTKVEARADEGVL